MSNHGLFILPYILFFRSRFAASVSLLFCVSLPATARSPGHIFDHITHRDGLSSNKVEAVLQDSEGLYWIATADGLNMFDGTHFRIFRTHPYDTTTLPNNHCNVLLEDKEGHIWVGTNKGLARYNKRTGTFRRFYIQNGRDNFDPLNRILSLSMDKTGRIWVGSYRLSFYDSQGFTTITDRVIYATNLHYDTVNDAVWYETPEGIRYFSIPYNKVVSATGHLNLLSMGRGFTFCIRGSRLWYFDFANSRLCSLDLNTWHERQEVHIPLPEIRKIFADDRDNIWLYFRSRDAIIYNTVHKTTEESFFKKYHDKSALSGLLNNIYIDKERNYWFSSREGISIYRENSRKYKYYNLPAGMEIICGAWKNPRQLILSVADGLYEFSHEENRLSPLKLYGVPRGRISSLEISGDTLILGMKQKVILYHLSRKKVLREWDIQGTPWFFIRQGPVLWTGTWSSGLYRHDLSPQSPEHSAENPGGLLYPYLVSGVRSASGGIWVGYNGGYGFSHLRDGKPEHYRIAMDSSLRHTISNTVTSLEEDRYGNLWIGTFGGGLYHFLRNENRYEMYLQSDGLQSDFINKTLLAGDTLWVHTSNGINYIPLATRKVYTVDMEMIFPSDDVHNSALRSPDGVLWFFCQNKILSVVPGTGNISPAPTQLIISRFKVLDKEIKVHHNQTLHLEYAENRISFAFSVIKTHPGLPVQYAYQLAGVNEDWVLTRTPDVSYATLAPGSYDLLIRVVGDAGEWGEPFRLGIVIHPPFWQTWWFRSLSGLLVLGFLGYMITLEQRKQINKLKRENEIIQLKAEKEVGVVKERERIIADLHDDIGATLSGMSIYGELAGRVWEENPLEGRRIIAEISSLSRSLLDHMSDIIWSMKAPGNEKYTLEARVRNYANDLLAPRNILWEVDIAPHLDLAFHNPETRKNLLLIAKEAINNAAKYSAAHKVRVSLKKKNGRVILGIADDGRGFDVTTVTPGNGLGNIEKRCHSLGGEYRLSSGPGEGTRVTCTLPEYD